MVAHNDEFNGVAVKNVTSVDELKIALGAVIPSNLSNDDVVFLCIGTDRSTGDSFGPLVGTYLEGLGYTNVIGTVDAPAHAVNLVERASEIRSGKTIIAIDACLGKFDHVGTLSVVRGAIRPGAGVKKDLGEYGDYSIQAVVNVAGFMEYLVLQNTRLSVVMRMAKDLTTALIERFPLDGSLPKPIENTVVEALQEVAV